MSSVVRPRARSASWSDSHDRGTPASTTVSRPPSSIRYQFVLASSIRWTPSATFACSMVAGTHTRPPGDQSRRVAFSTERRPSARRSRLDAAEEELRQQPLSGERVLALLRLAEDVEVEAVERPVDRLDRLHARARRLDGVLAERELVEQNGLLPPDLADLHEELERLDEVDGA